MALYNSTNGARWAATMCTQQDGPHDTHGHGVTSAACRKRPDGDQKPCPLLGKSKTNDVCLKCPLRYGKNPNMTQAEIDAMCAAVEFTDYEAGRVKGRKPYYSPNRGRYAAARAEHEPRECAMEWCHATTTRGDYCELCQQLIWHRKSIGVEDVYKRPRMTLPRMVEKERIDNGF